MKLRNHIIIFCLIFFIAVLINGENLSPKLLRLMEKQKGLSFLSVKKHAVTKELLVSVIIRTNNIESDYLFIKNIGGLTHSLIGEFITADIPVNRLKDISKRTSIIYVSETKKKKYLLNKVRESMGVDKLYYGTNLPKKYTGKGVIVGIVDSGLDVNHDDFKDSSGQTRVLYLWDQTVEYGVGPTEIENTFGAEWTAAQINSKVCSEEAPEGHGTHVAGIAAGNGSRCATYRGIAPEADLIIVKTDFDHDVDGVNYIFKKARKLGKPAVVNMSLGGHFGPHDGTSNYEQSLNTLVNKGNIIVVAAGNEGLDKIHYRATATAVEKKVTFDLTDEIADFEVWYDQIDEIKKVSFSFDVLNKSGNVVYTAGPIEPGEYYEKDFDAPKDGVNDESVNFIIVDARETLNANNRASLVSITYGNENNYRLRIRYTGNTSFDMWVVTNGLVGTFEEGDALSTVGAPGTVKNVITVAAYTTKSEWVGFGGDTVYNQSRIMGWPVTVGNIAAFSSRGPTRKPEITGLKPEISAPGELVFSANSSFSSPDKRDKDTTGYYVKMEGTSMASPAVSGLVALLLESNPNLSAAAIESILTSKASSDIFTGIVPNNIWGYGKANASNSIIDIINKKYNFTIKQDTIFNNEIWTDTVYIVAPINISSNASLTIKPSASLYFDSNVWIRCQSGASIIFEGTETSEILCSLLPEYNQTNYQWKGLILDNGSKANIKNVLFQNSDTAVYLNNASCSITYCKFNNNSGSIYSDSSIAYIYRNIFYNSEKYGINLINNGNYTINHNSIVNCSNYGIKLNSAESKTKIINNIIAYTNGFGVSADDIPESFTFNDIYSNDSGNYNGFADQTGLNGNISADPNFAAWESVQNDLSNLKLSSNSPLKFAASDSLSIGALDYQRSVQNSENLVCSINKTIQSYNIKNGSYNNVVLSFLLANNNNPDTLTGIRIKQYGSLKSDSITALKLWVDACADGMLDSRDTFVSLLSPLSANIWSADTLQCCIDNYFIISIDVDTNAPIKSYFQVGIEQMSCTSLLSKVGPVNAIVNQFSQIILNSDYNNVSIDSSKSVLRAVTNPEYISNIIDIETSIINRSSSVQLELPTMQLDGLCNDTVTVYIEFADTSSAVRFVIKNRYDTQISALCELAKESVLNFGTPLQYDASLNTLRDIKVYSNNVDISKDISKFKKILITFTKPQILSKGSEICCLNESSKNWDVLDNSSYSTNYDTISSVMTHFSTYCLFLRGIKIEPNLSKVVIYPNPFKPNDGDWRTGVEFNGDYSINNKTGIHIAGLTENSVVEIYTISGRLVKKLTPLRFYGAAIWDAKTTEGSSVSSGIYIAVIKDNGNVTVEKIMVIR